jgi:hypothetical protein
MTSGRPRLTRSKASTPSTASVHRQPLAAKLMLQMRRIEIRHR